MVGILFPKDAGEVLRLPVVKRCTNCEDYDTCDKLKEMKKKSKYKALTNMINRTNCERFSQGETIVVDDEIDIRTLLSMPE